MIWWYVDLDFLIRVDWSCGMIWWHVDLDFLIRVDWSCGMIWWHDDLDFLIRVGWSCGMIWWHDDLDSLIWWCVDKVWSAIVCVDMPFQAVLPGEHALADLTWKPS